MALEGFWRLPRARAGRLLADHARSETSAHGTPTVVTAAVVVALLALWAGAFSAVGVVVRLCLGRPGALRAVAAVLAVALAEGARGPERARLGHEPAAVG